MSRKNAYCRSMVARTASGSSVTTTGAIAMTRSACLPIAAMISGTPEDPATETEAAKPEARAVTVSPSKSTPPPSNTCRRIVRYSRRCLIGGGYSMP